MQLKYRKLNKEENEKVIIQIIDTLLDKSIPYSGKHRQEQWEKGWNQNLKEKSLTPHYFGKYKINRLNGKFVEAISPNYERDMLYSIIDKFAKKYLKQVDNIYEFGCGTGHNLLRVSKINRQALLYGFDWVKSSVLLVRLKGMIGYLFDFFKPDKSINLEENSGVYTVAALEQTGTNYKKFIEYLIKNKPKVCVHIEPIAELLDPKVLMDYLSIKYFEKRKYLSGFLTYLKELEKEGRILIHEVERNKIGSLFIEGYSVIVWSPK